MKFESKLGIGEIVFTKRRKGDDRTYKDETFKVVAVIFKTGGTVSYACRHPVGQVFEITEQELIGDPEFDQEHGYIDDENNE